MVIFSVSSRISKVITAQLSTSISFRIDSSLYSKSLCKLIQKVKQSMGNCLSNCQANDSRTEQVLPALSKSSLKQKWFQLLSVHSVKFTAENYLSGKASHPSFLQIDKDLNRTYPHELQFSIEQNKIIFKESLEEIALYFPKLGYIQGINFIVGFFVLCEMNKIETIKTFIAIVMHPKLMLFRLYEDDFSLIRLYCSLFWSLMDERLPKFSSKIKDLNVPDELWIFQWFLCLYIYSFPRSYMKDILTFIWQEKEFAMVKIAVAIMELFQPTLSKVSDNRFQDDFIESMEMIKSESYVKEKLPVKKLLQKAKLIDNAMVNKHLGTLKTDCQPKQYFLSDEGQRKKMYKRFKQELERDRKEFIEVMKKGMVASKSSREGKSATMIDHIEQLRAARFNITLINSLTSKAPNSSFVRYKQRYSLVQEPLGNKPLVQSLYIN